MKPKKKRYQILVAGKWVDCKKAKEQPSGWLHYELTDGTNGLTQPKKWREKLMDVLERWTQP